MKTNKVDDSRILVDYRDVSSSSQSSSSTKETGMSSPDSSGVAEHCMTLLDTIWAGESALHLAVVNGDLPAVKYLVSKGADVNHRTIKNLFDDKNKSILSSAKEDEKYKAFGYYGEYPLSFAAVFNHTEIYDYLIQHGANTNAQDSYGNTVLHIIVIHDQIDMFSYSMRHPWKRANPWTKNNDGLTPISLCCQLGYSDMFNEIMELSRVEITKYSDLESSLFPMASFDTIGPDGHTDHKSAMMILVNGEKSGHLEMLYHVAVQKILAEKWRVFVRKRFVMRLITFITHITLLTTVIYVRPKGRSIGYENYKDGVRYACELILFGGSCSTFVMHIEEIKTSGFRIFVRSLKNAPSKVMMLLSVFLIISVVNLRVAMFIHPDGNHTKLLIAEESFLAIAAPTGFSFFLFFLKTHSSYGPLIITLYTMIAKDVTKVMIIFAVFWIMFAALFLYLYKGTSINSFNEIDTAVMSVFHMSFGSFEYKHFESSKFPSLTAFFFLLSMLLMPILLLNMLIATMANTFNTVTERSHQEWFHQYAKTVITLERAFPKEQLAVFQQQYTKELTRDTFDCRYKKGKNRGYLQDLESDVIVAGLPVTKRVANTKAFAKKRSLKNWKWLYGVVRAILKAKRAELKVDRRITYWDLFGTDDILDNDYLREKMVAENLRKVSLAHLFKRNFEQDDLLTVATKALGTKTPAPPAVESDKNSSGTSKDKDSLDDLLDSADV